MPSGVAQRPRPELRRGKEPRRPSDSFEERSVAALGLPAAGCAALAPQVRVRDRPPFDHFPTIRLRIRRAELQRKVHQRLLMAIHFAEKEALTYLSDFVAKPAGDERGLRVIEHYAWFAVKQTGSLVDPGDDRIE